MGCFEKDVLEKENFDTILKNVISAHKSTKNMTKPEMKQVLKQLS